MPKFPIDRLSDDSWARTKVLPYVFAIRTEYTYKFRIGTGNFIYRSMTLRVQVAALGVAHERSAVWMREAVATFMTASSCSPLDFT